MTIVKELEARLARAVADLELGRVSPHLVLAVRLRVGSESLDFGIADGRLTVGTSAESPEIQIAAADNAWQRLLMLPPPPTYQSFTALEIANDSFEISGDRLIIAQARPALERIFEIIVNSPAMPCAALPRDLGQIAGSYAVINVGGIDYEIYVESSGQGIPVLMLHTAGADGRQYFDQLADSDLAQDYRLIVPDLPFHGKSMPPRIWDGRPYELTAKLYASWCVAIIEQVIGEPVILVGGSMGAAITLVLAAERPDLLLGAIAVEPPFRAKGRINRYQNDVAVNAGLHNSAFVRGLMAPLSPESSRRRAAWIYSQGAPGVYPADLAFYSLEFDGAAIAPMVDAKRLPVVLLCGVYDYSASPADGARLQALMPGAHLVVMENLGHFPMCEHAEAFRPHFYSALQRLNAHRAPDTRVEAQFTD